MEEYDSFVDKSVPEQDMNILRHPDLILYTFFFNYLVQIQLSPAEDNVTSILKDFLPFADFRVYALIYEYMKSTLMKDLGDELFE